MKLRFKCKRNEKTTNSKKNKNSEIELDLETGNNFAKLIEIIKSKFL